MVSQPGSPPLGDLDVTLLLRGRRVTRAVSLEHGVGNSWLYCASYAVADTTMSVSVNQSGLLDLTGMIQHVIILSVI